MIKILGAGPAGLTAGINIAKAGYKVTIYEKNKVCGARFHGDLQGLENWSEKSDVVEDIKSMNIKINFLCKPFTQLDLYDSDLRLSEITSEDPLFYFVRRGDVVKSLDRGLVKQALNSGVKIKFGTFAKEKDCDIIAKGPTTADGIVKGITFKTKMADNALCIVDDTLAQNGYVYLLICGGYGCLATVIMKHFSREREYFENTLQRINDIIDLDISDKKEYAGFGNFFLAKDQVYGSSIHIGEGSGMQDFLLGFGMRYAITSGYLAAKSITEDKDYDKLIKRLISQQKASIVNRFLYEKLGGRFASSILRMGKLLKYDKALYNLYNYSILHRAILPFAKFSMKSKVNRHEDCHCTWCRSKKQEYE